MIPQHISDEAVAAFADGVLSGSARERAARHVDVCAECREAVRVQREAALALRAAAAPEPPNGLVDRLRTVPLTTALPTPLTTLPTALGPDGSPMLATFAPAAALVPQSSRSTAHRVRPAVTAAAIVALAGTLAAGSVARESAQRLPGVGQVVSNSNAGHGHQPGVGPVSFLRLGQP